MSFENPITIREAIENIDKKDYLLPAIQREFVWKHEQIESLFDSLMRGYPIGSFLFWKVEGDKKNEFKFYEFIRNYTQYKRKGSHNPEAKIIGDGPIISILDGQQRLTALDIGLRGSYAYKTPYRRIGNSDSYPPRQLYLDLLNKSDKVDMEFNFRFLTEKEVEEFNKNGVWFLVGEILNFSDLKDLLKYIDNLETDVDKFKLVDPLSDLFQVINKEPIINYYLEKGEELDKVLNIFIRVNSGGTTLSYSDLLLSTAIAQWSKTDARKVILEFVDTINDIGDGFEFDKDFVLKSCLVLINLKNIAFKVDNFKKENMLHIENDWELISDSIKLSIELFASFGYNEKLLTANNAVIPVAYYIMKKGNPKNFITHSTYAEDREMIRKWLNICLLKRVFGGQSDNVLTKMRESILETHSSFPLDNMVKKLKRTSKSLTFDEDEIDNLFYYQYGQNYTFSTLALLYPSLDFKNRFHIDHIYPKSFYTRSKLEKMGITNIETYMNEFNSIANLQLLEGPVNEEKSNKLFNEWLNNNFNEEKKRIFMETHYIPNVDLTFNNFEEFIIERKKLMREKFELALKI